MHKEQFRSIIGKSQKRDEINVNFEKAGVFVTKCIIDLIARNKHSLENNEIPKLKVTL